MKKLNKNLVLLIIATLLIASCKQNKEQEAPIIEALPYYNEASFTPQWLEKNDPRLNFFHTIPAFKLYNQNGMLVTKKTFEGKIYVANFFFTSCPGICPKMSDNMLVLQQEFLHDDEVLLISHSVTPQKDSVSVLKEYANKKGVLSNKWYLVTGNQAAIYKLGRQSYFVEEDMGVKKKTNEFLHTENFVLIDKKFRIRGIYNGLNSTAINQLIADIKTLQREK